MTGNAGQANYAASKAGVIGLTKATAKELASRGITVNAVAPGFIETDMTEVLTDAVKERIGIADSTWKHLVQPEQVAGAVAFLASEDAGYITGQVIPCRRRHGDVSRKREQSHGEDRFELSDSDN